MGGPPKPAPPPPPLYDCGAPLMLPCSALRCLALRCALHVSSQVISCWTLHCGAVGPGAITISHFIICHSHRATEFGAMCRQEAGQGQRQQQQAANCAALCRLAAVQWRAVPCVALAFSRPQNCFVAPAQAKYLLGVPLMSLVII